MEPQDDVKTAAENLFCPECGAEETGYFCRSCGTLVQGGDRMLCPRCHRVVPAADYCNECGQGLKNMALTLQQLALAGEDFWMAGGTVPASAAAGTRAPDTAAALAAPEMPDWLRELPTDKAPVEVQERIYPALQPVSRPDAIHRENRFLIVVLLLMGVMLIGLVAAAVFLLAQGVS